MLVGTFVIYEGVVSFWTGHCARQKIRAITSDTSSFSMEQLQEQFAMADMDGQGALTWQQFQQFVSNLGLDLNKREAEAIFLKLDKSRTGRVAYESIQRTWGTK